MPLQHSPTDEKVRLAPSFKTVTKMTAEEMRLELAALDLPTTGNKAALSERLRKARERKPDHLERSETQQPYSPLLDQPGVSPDPFSIQTDKPTDLMMMFTLMKQQQQEAEKRFLIQQEASEKRFLMQLQGMRQDAKEERENLTKFFADVRKEAEKSNSSGDSNLPSVIGKRFKRMDNDLVELLQALELKYTTSNSVDEIEVYVKSVEMSMTDLKSYVDGKIDLLEDSDLKTEILNGLKAATQVYLTNIPLAKAKLSKLRAIEDADKTAGSLPNGVHPPSFYGDILGFPSFWEAFEPLVHNNPSVSKFYKMTYLKAAMKGSASGVLDGFPISAGNYKPAIAAVLKRFGRTQAIVRSHIKDLLDEKRVDLELDKVRSMLDRANAKRSILAQNKVTWDQMFTQILESQLPQKLLERWMRKISPLIESDQIASSDLMFEFIATELATMDTLKRSGSKQSEKQPKSKQHTPNTDKYCSAQSLVTQSLSSLCAYCNKSHPLLSCREFLKLTPAQRMSDLIKKSGKVCFRCLAPKGESGHPKQFYQCRARCEVEGCGKAHHQLLHVFESSNAKTMVSTARRSAACDSEIDTLLPTALAQISNGGKTRRVRIAFDSLSEKSFITRNVANCLQLPAIRRQQMNISGFGGSSTSNSMDLVTFNLEPLHSKSRGCIDVQAFVQEGVICTPLDNVALRRDQVTHLAGLSLADPLPRNDGTVDILLGARYYFSLMQGSVISPTIPESGPFAIDTIFGWVLAGPCSRNSSVDRSSNCLLTRGSSEVRRPDLYPWQLLDDKLERFWKQDCIGLTDKDLVHTADEVDAISQFNDSVSFDGGKYCVSLPFKRDAIKLQPNFAQAYSRLLTTEKTLRKNPDRLAKYDHAIMEYVENGFARKLSQAELDKISTIPHYYVPHHPVFREASCSTKLRIVFDASAKNSCGYSLNDCVLKGPNLLPDIGAVLLRFRTHKIALSGDIRKMFCQTAISPDHQHFQLYLWRNCDSRRAPDVYVMERIMFGVSSSPFLAIQAIHHHSKTAPIIDKFGRDLGNEVVRNMYVDDIHVGGNSVEDVVQKQKRLVEFFQDGGWSLVKFASNNREVMDRIPEEARLPNCVLDLDDANNGEASSLGLKWHTTQDVMYCNVKPRLLEQDEVVTKRSILSKLSQIYDVFGYFSAFVVTAKILMQELWKQKLDWNDPVDDVLAKKYRQWTDELSLLESIKIPRYLFCRIPSPKSIQLHGFSDASENAYGAVVYIRAEDDVGNIQTQYLIAKTRVAPLKSISVARLELMAAHSLAKLTRYVLDALSSDICIDKVYLWLDSEIALAWIAKPSSHWKTFVRNRVQEIHDLVSPHAWRHCPGIDNPADYHSRGMTLEQLKSCSRYWHGPDWLMSGESLWPAKPHTGQMNPQVETETASPRVLVNITQPPIPFFGDRYSNYSKIVRITARILRWRYRDYMKMDPECSNRFIGPNEFRMAEMFLLRLIQRSRFSNEFENLDQGRNVSNKSQIKDMDPRVDLENQLIVAGDRLSLSDLPQCTSSPIILPAKEPLVEKLILRVHESNSHSPQDTTIAILRERFLIIHIRSEVRRVLRNCIVCRHSNTKPLKQKMGILPKERICASPAFSQVGLDFTGPIYIKTGDDAMQKAYICLFTCPHSRMIHLELTNDMSTEEFIGALQRMINRRGWCQEIICDNQLTFKKAERLIQISTRASFKRRSDNEALQKFLTDNGITWKYITERAPHRGAFYERMNRSIKEPLRKILGKAKLNFAELYTILTDIECAMNQRPLTYLGSDPRNPQAITPAHLAIGRPLRHLPNFPYKASVNVSKRFRYLQTLLRHFWARWSKEYLPTLIRRSKWTSEHSVPNVGDVCLIADDGYARANWKVGRVVHAIKSKDGLVRTFKLKTARGFLSRPVQKLHLLEKDYSVDCSQSKGGGCLRL